MSGDTATTSREPIKDIGRMDHEAVTFDPISGTLYLTEDDRNQSGFYKFIPNDMSQKLGALVQGGTHYMAKVVGSDKADLLDPRMGDHHQIERVKVEGPDFALQGFTETPFEADNLASGPFVPGRNLGGLRMARGEGCRYSDFDRLIFIVDTATGVDDEGGIGRGEGSVWAFDPALDQLTCIFQAQNKAAGNNV